MQLTQSYCSYPLIKLLCFQHLMFEVYLQYLSHPPFLADKKTQVLNLLFSNFAKPVNMTITK